MSLGMMALLVLWFFLLRPAYLGGPATYVIVSGISMEPTMYTGDLALVFQADDYTIGDIVSFTVSDQQTGEKAIVIHRVVGGTADDGFITQGDNNDNVDPWRPTRDEIVGKTVLFIPRVGAFLSYLQDPVRIAVAVGAVSLYTSLAGLLLAAPSGSRQRRRVLRIKKARRRAALPAILSW